MAPEARMHWIEIRVRKSLDQFVFWDALPIRKSQTIRRQDRAVSMDQDGLDPQQAGDLAGVLPSSPSETRKTDMFDHRQLGLEYMRVRFDAHMCLDVA